MKRLPRYLKALKEARIRFAPPWPASAQEYMTANGLRSLDGWYDGPDATGQAKVYLALTADLPRILTEEVLHHTENDLTHGALAPLVEALLRRPVWAVAVRDRIIALLLVARKRRT